MRASLIAGILILLMKTPAFAGPWARGEGEVFLSFSYELTTDRDGNDLTDVDHAATIYGEYGIARKTTFGVDLFRNLSAADQTAIVFLRRTLSQSGATHQFAVSFGLGRESDPTGSEALSLLGASWGRGIDTRFGPGWATVDAQARLRSSGGTETKIDATLGVSPTDDWKLIGQLQFDATSGSDPTARLQTTAVRRISPALNIEFGVLYGLHNDSRTGLKSGLWLEF